MGDILKKGIRQADTLFTIDIVGPFFDDPLGSPAAPEVTALLGGAVVFGLFPVLISIFCFPRGFRGLIQRRPWLLVPPEVVSLAARVPALPLAAVAPVMVTALPGLLLRLLGLRSRRGLIVRRLLWLF